MHSFVKTAALATVLLTAGQHQVDAFGAPLSTRAISSPFGTVLQQQQQPLHRYSSSSPTLLYSSNDDSDSADSEVERLRSMAAKLRAEAAALEAEKAQETADATQRAFGKFDTDADGQITLVELKAGLEKVLKTELKQSRVEQLMRDLDASGDGALQVEEFVTVEQFRGRLEAIVRDEQATAREAARQAKMEQETAALSEAKMELLNDKAPSGTDKLLSILPYLFPLMDGLQFGRFLLEGQDNPAVAVLAVLYTLYRSIPFSGFIAFLALNVLSGNLSINRLIRFNMQQAIYLDIALFVPGFIASVSGLVLSGAGVTLDPTLTALGSDLIFVTLLLTIAYTMASSLLGYTPDKIPFMSEAVNQRMPTIDMLDGDGRFIMPEEKDDGGDDKKQ